MINLPHLPYTNTAGWSGTDTSMARAVDNVTSGRELNNQEKTLTYIKNAGVFGVTWKELAIEMLWHHGNASGVLSVLHKEGEIARLRRTRGRCKIYISMLTAQMNPNMLVETYNKKSKPCPHCGNDIYGVPV